MTGNEADLGSSTTDTGIAARPRGHSWPQQHEQSQVTSIYLVVRDIRLGPGLEETAINVDSCMGLGEKTIEGCVTRCYSESQQNDAAP